VDGAGRVQEREVAVALIAQEQRAARAEAADRDDEVGARVSVEVAEGRLVADVEARQLPSREEAHAVVEVDVVDLGAAGRAVGEDEVEVPVEVDVADLDVVAVLAAAGHARL